MSMSSILKKSMPQNNAEKLKTMFIGLGKPTMRGVRKCINCGTLNGTRGVSCKNKLCGAVFKERGKKKGHSAEAVKIHAGSSILLYSVRLRDRGPDYRGFVQLPIFQDMDGNPATVDSSIIAQNAHCFVESCTLNTGIGGLQEDNGCVHIRTAISAMEEATQLEMYESVINGLPIPSDMLETLNELIYESSGLSSPLVQRVTRNIMVVKCKVTNKHPFGFLHVAFSETSRNRSETEHRFQCSCKEFKNARDYGLMKEESRRRCVHFYACLCAFASDDSLSKEFSYYLNMEPEPQMIMTDQTVTIDQMVTDADGEVDNLVAFVADARAAQDTSSMLLSTEGIDEGKNLELVVDGEVVISEGHNKQQIIMNDGVFEDGQLVCLQTVDQDTTTLLTVQDSNKYSNISSTPTIIIAPSPISVQPTSTSRSLLTNSPKKATSTGGPADERGTSLTFVEWLASVTDRINDTMHYQFDGNPDPLVFHVPQKFFDCLQQRISVSSKKKRLPNSATAFVRKDALPLGMFTKYTWNIMNITHVKQIFDTPMRPLEVTRRFVENRDGTFDLYNAPKENTVNSLYGKQPIRPFELKTYLKVGSMTEKEPLTPFVIEWIPDILPKSQIGELRIKLCYGHQRNGQVEQRFLSHGRTELQTINIQK